MVWLGTAVVSALGARGPSLQLMRDAGVLHPTWKALGIWGGIALDTVLALYALAGACWLPVVWLQWRMADMARQAHDTDQPLPATYWRHARWWEALGCPAFLAMLAVLAVYYLMVNKPALWGA